MAKALSSLAVGALVKDTGTLYNGKPIVWKIADKGHSGYPSGSVTLITEKIISLKCFDAIESGNSDSNRRSYGNNRWIYSNIRQWLNSTAAAGKWYSAKHSADAAPTNANVWSNYNEYDQEAGFLAGFSANFRAALLDTTHTVGKSSTDGGGTETCVDKIFFASCTEVGLSGDATCGTKLALFSDNNSRLAYPTAECVSKSEYTNNNFAASKAWYWWLCDAYASSSYNVRRVASSGALSRAYSGDGGVRPLCNLSSSILVSDTTDSDGAYTIVWNQAPTVPGSITVPTDVRGGTSLTVSWGASTDSDGNLSGYILERQHDGGAWTQVYKGINRTYTDAITFGWANVAYRVKAYDSAGAESAYKTSATRTVVNNTAPTISGTDSNLGTKTGPFNQGYTVTDPDSLEVLSTGRDGQNFMYRGEGPYHINLLGHYQLSNALTALDIAAVLRRRGWPISREAVMQGMREAVWPARMELARRNPDVILDGGHNPQCMGAIRQALEELYPGKKILFLVGVLEDKDYHAMVGQLLPLARAFITITPDSQRALQAQALADYLRPEGAEAHSCETVEQCMEKALSMAGPEDVVCVCGSLYMIGEARHVLGLC